MAAVARCPMCARAVAARERNRAFPFCSPRCKLLDLGKWLDEAYRIPASDSSDAADDSTDSTDHQEET